MSSDKAKTEDLLDRPMGMKYDYIGGVRTLVMKMVDIAVKFNELKIPIAKPFLFHYVLNSLPSWFGQLKVLI